MDCSAEAFKRASGNPIVDRSPGHRRAVYRYPKRLPDRARPSSVAMRQDGSMAAEIGLESGDERFRPPQLDRFISLGLLRRILNPPFLAAENQRAIEGKANKIGQT